MGWIERSGGRLYAIIFDLLCVVYDEWLIALAGGRFCCLIVQLDVTIATSNDELDWIVLV